MPPHTRPFAAAAVLVGLSCSPPRTPIEPPPAPRPERQEEPPRARVDSQRAVPAPAPAARRLVASSAVRVCAGGDVTLGTNLDTTWTRRASRQLRRRVAALPNPQSLLAPLRPLLGDADVVLVNVEGAIGSGAAPAKCDSIATNCYAFRQPVSAAAALRRLTDGAPVVGNLANNHSMDAGADGLRATARHLDDAGVHVTGVDTLPTIVATSRGDSIAFLGFSTSAGPDPRDLDGVRRHVARAAALYPRVVVTMHMGAEGRDAMRTPDTTEIFLGTVDRGNSVAFARAAVDAGADFVAGHGPHVMRAIEWRGDALVMYSLGNLVTYGPFSFRDPMDRGAIGCVLLDPEGRVVHAALRSTRQRPPGLVSRDPFARAALIADSLSRLDFPRTGARVAPEAAVRRR